MRHGPFLQCMAKNCQKCTSKLHKCIKCREREGRKTTNKPQKGSSVQLGHKLRLSLNPLYLLSQVLVASQFVRLIKGIQNKFKSNLIPKLQWCNRLNLGTDKYFHHTICLYIHAWIKVETTLAKGPWEFGQHRQFQYVQTAYWPQPDFGQMTDPQVYGPMLTLFWVIKLTNVNQP